MVKAGDGTVRRQRMHGMSGRRRRPPPVSSMTPTRLPTMTTASPTLVAPRMRTRRPRRSSTHQRAVQRMVRDGHGSSVDRSPAAGPWGSSAAIGGTVPFSSWWGGGPSLTLIASVDDRFMPANNRRSRPSPAQDPAGLIKDRRCPAGRAVEDDVAGDAHDVQPRGNRLMAGWAVLRPARGPGGVMIGLGVVHVVAPIGGWAACPAGGRVQWWLRAAGRGTNVAHGCSDRRQWMDEVVQHGSG